MLLDEIVQLKTTKVADTLPDDIPEQPLLKRAKSVDATEAIDAISIEKTQSYLLPPLNVLLDADENHRSEPLKSPFSPLMNEIASMMFSFHL